MVLAVRDPEKGEAVAATMKGPVQARALELADTGSGLNALFGEIPWTAVEVAGAAADVDRPEDLPPGTRSA